MSSEMNVNLTAASPVQTQSRSPWKAVFSLREMGVYYALILLVIMVALVTAYLGRSNYLSGQNIANVLYQASLVAIMAVPMTVVLVSGNFDLSVASVAALAGAILLGTADTYGFGVAFALAMLAATLAGLLNGAIVQFIGINAFIVTLGTLTAIRGLMMIYTDGKSLYAKSPEVIAAMKSLESGLVQATVPTLLLGAGLILAGIVQFFRPAHRSAGITPMVLGLVLGGLTLITIVWSSGFDLNIAKPVIYMVIMTIVSWFVLNYTNVGRRLYAVGSSPEAARLSGINVTQYKLMAFVLCSATAGFAGILFASRLRAITPNALSGTELTVIAAAILGGTSLFGGVGSVVKTVAGALLLFTLTNGFNVMNLGTNYQGLVEGFVVVAAAAIYTVGGTRSGKFK